MGQPNQEPSMEDILASIKRIIAEDSEAATARNPRSRRGPVAVPDPVVTEPEPEVEPKAVWPGQVSDIVEPEQEPPAAAAEPLAETEEPVVAEPVTEEPADVLELTSPLIDPEPESMSPAASASDTLEPETRTEPTPASAQTAQAAPAQPTGPILSGAAALASRNAFAALSQLQVRTDEGKSNTLEGLVADLLRPMLRDWLDRELPGIVERLVSAEVSRLSRG
jgi:uncharacterized protein